MATIISREELKNLVGNKANYFLIDVRNKNELKFGAIPTSKNIPLPQIPLALKMQPEDFERKFKFPKFKKEDNIIFYCRTGERSHIATSIAISKGFINSKNFAGSIWSWSEIDSNVKKYEH